MKFRKPTPSMAVAIVALVVAMTGTAAAAVSYAKRAGAVDGLSAVLSRVSKNHAAGKLVATARTGPHKGQIPSKFVSNVPVSTTFSKATEVVDGQAGGLIDLNRTFFGVLRASCNDQANQTGNEDPTTTISFENTSGQSLSLSRIQGTATPVVESRPTGTVHSFVINGSNTFRMQIEYAGTDVVYEGQVRQDGRGTAAGSCYVAGTVETVTP
jgi:hypothetical protein